MKKSLQKKYGAMAIDMSQFSKNNRLKVGCLILKNNRIVSSGYNGTLPGEKEQKIMIDGHDIATVHAEQNCLMNCCFNGIATKGCEMVVSHFPCQLCTKSAIMAGIQTIYYVNDYRNEDNPFKKKIKMVRIHGFD